MSEFWKRKVRTYFSTFDFDKDGVITKADWTEIAIRFGQFETSDAQKAEYLKTQFENVWEKFLQYAENKEQMTADILIDSLGKQRYDPALMKPFEGMLRALFGLMDLNYDGYLQESEYNRMLSQSGVPDPSFTKEAFNAIDVSGDGKMSIDEFVFGFFDFLFSEDEKSPFKYFLGPLVD